VKIDKRTGIPLSIARGETEERPSNFWTFHFSNSLALRPYSFGGQSLCHFRDANAVTDVGTGYVATDFVIATQMLA
jgi:hypothetical protein